jgi:shikimate kinase
MVQFMTQKKWLTLIGHRACGKSSVGRKTAEILQRPFFDLDEFIVKREGLEITEIFRFFREDGFRSRETLALLNLPKMPIVLSCGGGTVINPENARYLQKCSTLVFLNTERYILEMRRLQTENIKKRPLLGNCENIHAELDALFAPRQQIYQQFADITINCEDKNINEIAAEIVKIGQEKHVF